MRGEKRFAFGVSFCDVVNQQGCGSSLIALAVKSERWMRDIDALHRPLLFMSDLSGGSNEEG